MKKFVFTPYDNQLDIYLCALASVLGNQEKYREALIYIIQYIRELEDKIYGYTE